MTAAGVTMYLFYLGEFILSLISVVVFGKLIIFHFIADYFDKQNTTKQRSKSLVFIKNLDHTLKP